MGLIFAFDFDDTLTEDLNSFGQFFKILQDNSHQTIIVTGRTKQGKWETEVMEAVDYLINKYNLKNIPVVFAGSEWKKQAAKNAGYNVNIWVDNSPEYIDKQYILKDLDIGQKDNYLSPETSGRIKKAMVETLKEAWLKKSEELKIYPKRLEPGSEKDNLWNKINKESQDIIDKIT